MSEVEQLWSKLAIAFNDNRTWHQLNQQQQQLFIQGVNQILAVCHQLV